VAGYRYNGLDRWSSWLVSGLRNRHAIRVIIYRQWLNVLFQYHAGQLNCQVLHLI